MAALRAAVLLIFKKNHRGGAKMAPPTGRGLIMSYIIYIIRQLKGDQSYTTTMSNNAQHLVLRSMRQKNVVLNVFMY